MVDWNLYGKVCYRQREAVLRALVRAMQPIEIKRRAKSQNSQLKMSANNARDVIQYFLDEGIVRKLEIGGRTYPLYEPTEVGRKFQFLLLQAEFST